MSEYKTTMNGKPATVDIADDGSLAVTCHNRTWRFDADLKPAFWDGGPLVKLHFKTDKNGSLIQFTDGLGESSAIPAEEGMIAVFRDALDTVNNIPKQTPLPPQVKNKLPAALALLGGIAGPVRT